MPIGAVPNPTVRPTLVFSALERTWVVHPGQWVFLNSDWWVHRAEVLPELDGAPTPMSLSVAREINDDDNYASSMMLLQVRGGGEGGGGEQTRP